MSTIKANAYLDAAGGSTATVNGTLIPASGVTLVSTAATQTLTNKIIDAGQLTGALPAISGAALTSLPALGIDQTWQTVTGSRALNTNYTNSTGKPIMVNIMIIQGTGGQGRFRVDGIDVSGQNLGTAGLPVMISAVVPPNGVYQMATTAGSQSISFWAELR